MTHNGPQQNGRTWRVGLLFNLKHSVSVGSDAPPDALAEYDSAETVQALEGALRAAGHQVFPLEADSTLLDTLRQVRPDICFNIAEGVRGDARESHTPALLEMLGIPYTGSKVLTHALSLDKGMTKRVWRDAGLPTMPFQVFHHGHEPLVPSLAFPLFVKPVREGSGMGINSRSLVQNESELRAQVRWVIESYHQPAIAEGFLPGREFTVGLIGNTLAPGQRRAGGLYDEQGFHVFPILEIDATVCAEQGHYNYEAKAYIPGEAGAPLYVCPADVPPALEFEMKWLAVAAFEALGALDVARVDFRLGADGRPYLIEINTLPGMNPAVSDLCIVARAGGVDYPTLINEVLNLAAQRNGMLPPDRDTLHNAAVVRPDGWSVPAFGQALKRTS